MHIPELPVLWELFVLGEIPCQIRHTYERSALLNYSQYLFIDFENIQTLDLESIDNSVKVFVFVGSEQKKIPLNVVEKAQARGESLKWIQIAGHGRNALDFHIAFYLGELNQTAPDNVSFTLLSKDTGYDPLVEHINKLGRSCSRINSLKELSMSSKALDDPNTQRALANLSKIEKTKRPRTRNTLSKHMQMALGRKLGPEEAASVIDNLFMMGKVSETGGRLIYDL